MKIIKWRKNQPNESKRTWKLSITMSKWLPFRFITYQFEYHEANSLPLKLIKVILWNNSSNLFQNCKLKLKNQKYLIAKESKKSFGKTKIMDYKFFQK